MKRLSVALVPALLTAGPALAHLRPEEHGSFSAGLTHPMFGADHVLAMVSVGLWAAMLGGRAVWSMPAAFVGAMAGGFALALAGIGLPFVEPTILASVIVLGVLVAMSVRLSAPAGTVLVAAFALFHGYAHGTEIGGAQAATYLAGFASATIALHGVGLALGWGLNHIASGALVRGAGGAVALAGCALALAG